MSNFFNSDLVRNELSEISFLQKKILQSSLSKDAFDDDHNTKHLELLKELLEKQKIMCTRLSLTEDPGAKKLFNQLGKISQPFLCGDSEISVLQILKEMEDRIAAMEKALDSES